MAQATTNVVPAPTEAVTAASTPTDAVANQSGLVAGGGCGPMGLCLEPPPVAQVGADAAFVPDPNDVINSPPMSASPVLTAVFIVCKIVTMTALASVIGPAVSMYMILSSHIKFLERIEMVRKGAAAPSSTKRCSSCHSPSARQLAAARNYI